MRGHSPEALLNIQCAGTHAIRIRKLYSPRSVCQFIEGIAIKKKVFERHFGGESRVIIFFAVRAVTESTQKLPKNSILLLFPAASPPDSQKVPAGESPISLPQLKRQLFSPTALVLLPASLFLCYQSILSRRWGAEGRDSSPSQSPSVPLNSYLPHRRPEPQGLLSPLRSQ